MINYPRITRITRTALIGMALVVASAVNDRRDSDAGAQNVGNDIDYAYSVAAGTSKLIVPGTNGLSIYGYVVANTGAVWAAVSEGNWTQIVARGSSPAAGGTSKIVTNIDNTVTNLTGIWMVPTNGTYGAQIDGAGDNNEIRIVAHSSGTATGVITLKTKRN